MIALYISYLFHKIECTSINSLQGDAHGVDTILNLPCCHFMNTGNF